MNLIFSLHKADPGNKQGSAEETRENTVPPYYEQNITDGGEFLDDGIRMKEQPLEEAGPDEDE